MGQKVLFWRVFLPNLPKYFIGTNVLKESIVQKLEKISERTEEINALLADASVIANQNQFRALSMEYAQISPVAQCFNNYQSTVQAMQDAEQMMQENDAEMRELAAEEFNTSKDQESELAKILQTMLLPEDPHDHSNIFLEIRAGAGGDEAAIFAGDLFRMYSRYAEQKNWQVEIINESFGEHGGYKEVIARIIGTGAYSRLKFESGGHRV